MDKFDKAAGLYWFCNSYWHGQDDPLYAILCGLEYKPGLTEHGPRTRDAWRVYNDLIANKIDAEELLKEIQAE